MRIHYLQHNDYVLPGNIIDWANNNNYKLSYTKFYQTYSLPKHSEYDLLIILGGTMDVFEEDKYSWLIKEKVFILEAINANKAILGICLGGQLLAEVLGAKVYKNKQQEIGWFPITKKNNHPLLQNLNTELEVFLWHNYIFDIPKNTLPVLEGKFSFNQGFVYKDNVIALQFHPEMNIEGLKSLLENTNSNIQISDTVQSPNSFLQKKKNFEQQTKWMFGLLDNLIRTIN